MARDKLNFILSPWSMKLFRRRGKKPPKQPDEAPVPAAPADISLSAEQKSLLEKPIDPKAKNLQKGLRRIVPAPPPKLFIPAFLSRFGESRPARRLPGIQEISGLRLAIAVYLQLWLCSMPAHSDWCIMLCVKFVRQRDTSFHAL
jgi:hypothetical protein